MAPSVLMALLLAHTLCFAGTLVLVFELGRRLSGRAAWERDEVDSLADVSDSESSQIWINTWGHVTLVGNELVARQMDRVLVRGSNRGRGERRERTLK